MTMKSFAYILIICMLFWTFSADSQNLPVEQVQVVKNFDARLADANKIDIRPDLPDPDSSSRKYNYLLNSYILSVEYPAPSIKPVALSSDKLPPGYDGLIKAGYGYPSSPFAYLGYNFISNEQLNIGVNAQHYSLNDSKKLDNRRFALNDINLQGSYFSGEEFALDGKLGLSVDNYFLYGYDHDAITLTKEEVKRRFSTFDMGLNLFNGTTNNANFNYNAGVDFYHHSDNYATKENGVKLNLGGAVWIAKKHPLSLNLSSDFTGLKDTMSQSLNNFYLQPSFTFHGTSFKIKAGANVTLHDDEYKIFPDVEFAAGLSGNQLIFFAGWEGGLQKNTFRTLSHFNPFLTSRIHELNNTDYNNYFGGLKGTFSFIRYEIKGGYKQTEMFALFKAQDVVPTRFEVLYEDMNIIYGSGTIQVSPLKNLEASLNITKNVFNPSIQAEAWFLPSLQSNLTVRYKAAADRFILRGDVYYSGKIDQLNFDETTSQSNTLLDVNVHADYFISEKFGLFAEVNNMSNLQYRQWLNYPGIGINVLGGIQFRF